MKISSRVLLAALAAGLLLFVANQAELRWRSFAQFKERKKPTPTPVPKPASPNPAPRKPTAPRPKSGGASATTRRVAPEIEMVYVTGGSFLMGSPENEAGRYSWEGPQHRVTVQDFYIGKYEVTQAQWRAVMGNNPSRFKGDNLPVETVSWNDAKEFCRKLSQMTGKEYRLPTEAEWEYACRAKTTGAYAGDLDAMAWYSKNSDSKTHPVGQKQPNAFRLYDMHGNVWEWCEDQWHDNYNGAPNDGRAWVDISASVSNRVNRGGGCTDVAVDCRSADRSWGEIGRGGVLLGFRLVRIGR
jgi:formylglycine-generating enzyme required for sulfatase activity